MPISLPKFFQRAFAQNGGKQDVPITGDTSGGRASYDVGFPPVTRIPIVAGGIPPFGTDFNGVLYDLSQAIQYVQSGVSFPFNQDFATAIGGYEIGAIVSDSSDKSLLWINGTSSNTAFPTGWTQFSLKQSTETVLGLSRTATQAETNSGDNDSVIVTPKKLRAGFAAVFSENGYIAFPTWLGGFVLQWGRMSTGAEGSATGSFPLAFPEQCFVFAPTLFATLSASNFTVGGSVKNNSEYYITSSRGSTDGIVQVTVVWIAIGK